MQTRIDLFFARDVQAFCNRLSQLDGAIGPLAEARKDDFYRQLAAAMESMADACRRLETAIGHDPELVRDTQKRFQDAIAPWMHRSWIGQRALTKPRGYPGDYLLLNAIYDNVPKARGLGGYIDLYLLDWLLGRAVRTRWEGLREFLIEELTRRGGQASILNVACGPCREYVAPLPLAAEARVLATCLDHDQEALDFVAQNVASRARGGLEIRCRRYNALRMKNAEATVRNFGRSDIIYSIGLCDYISDEYLIGMLDGWRQSVGEGGVVYVAFKDGPRYDKTPYQWLLDWHFLYRTEEDCRRLFQQAGYDVSQLEMTRDATGVIMNFVSRTGVKTPLRFDAPHAADAPHTLSLGGAVAADPTGSAGPDALEAP